MVHLPPFVRTSLVGSLAAATWSVSTLSGTAAAQTVVLNQARTQVTDTTIRSGSYANTNLDHHSLITRRSTDPDWERRTMLKFDTDNFIPPGLGGEVGDADADGQVRARCERRCKNDQRVPRSRLHFRKRKRRGCESENGTRWSTPGGDHAELIGQASAKNTPGLEGDVQRHRASCSTQSDGDYGSRYTRLLLVDAGATGKDSYREFYPSEESNAALRPTLTVVLGSGTTSAAHGHGQRPARSR